MGATASAARAVRTRVTMNRIRVSWAMFEVRLLNRTSKTFAEAVGEGERGGRDPLALGLLRRLGLRLAFAAAGLLHDGRDRASSDAYADVFVLVDAEHEILVADLLDDPVDPGVGEDVVVLLEVRDE